MINLRERELKLISESTHQFRVVKWLEQRGHVCFAVPNGGSRNRFEAMRLKREGVRSGVPDIIILTPAKNNCSTAVEMKKYKGVKHKQPCNCMEESQKEWQQLFINNGFNHILAHGEEDAIADLIALGY